MVVEQEVSSQTVVSENQEQNSSVNETQQLKNEMEKNYQNLVKEQQEQIQQLLKQQELNKKMYQQLAESNQQLQNLNAQKQDNVHWVDRALEDFRYDATFDPKSMYFRKDGTQQVATWYLQYLKNQGLSNAEISHRMNNIFKTMEGVPQVHEDVS